MEPIRDLSADSTIRDVQGAIERVSEYRAMLGANQNALEHVVTVCESLQENGFGSGIEHADSTFGDAHHVLTEDLTSGQTFLAEWALMDHRVAELEEKKSNLHDDRDIKHIDMEIAALGVAKDFLIDLLCDVIGGELPRTGGAGMEAYVIVGTALVVMAGMGATWYVVRKRKDGGDGDRDA